MRSRRRRPTSRAGGLVPLVVLVALVWAARPVAVCGLDNEVCGYVVHGTQGVRLAEVPVALLVRDADGAVQEVARQSTDARGAFAFARMATGRLFTLAAAYAGVEQTGSPMRVGEQDSVIVEVFPATRSAAGLTIASHNLFLGLSGDEVDVAHLIQVENGLDSVFVGSGTAGAGQVTPLHVPAGAYGLESHTGELSWGPDGILFDSTPLPPGRSQITFTFRLDARGLGGDGYVHLVLLPTTRLDVFLRPVGLHPGADFTALGVVELHGAQYGRWRREALRAGERVAVAMPRRRDWPVVIRWGALLCAAVAAGGAAWLGRTRAAGAALLSPAQQQALAVRRQRLVERLAQSGRLGGAESVQRQELTEQALAISRILASTHGPR